VAGPHHVVLVPGFFGFANLGDFTYFGHVRDLLAEVGPAAGLDGEIRIVFTEPSSSLPRRAALLAESIHRLIDQRGGVVSIVGHSTGALDGRLMLNPGSLLPTRVDVERCAAAVRAVVGVAAPHHGTPLAQHFTSLLGSQLLKLLSLATVYSLRTGRLPVGVALRLARLLRRRDSTPTGVVDQLFLQLLSDFTGKRRRAIEEFFSSVHSDQGLVPQLAPGAMELFNAATVDRPGVRYGEVITRARPPGLRSLTRAGLSGYAQTTHALYVVLYRLARGRSGDPTGKLSPEHRKFLRRAYGSIPDHRANDGIVPTLSQVRGQLVAAVWADHHDVLGHFHRPRHVPPHFDWVASGTGFDREHFEAVWKAVARFLGEAG
jgi:triacylglycerol esterase/lipase EstA (alpha/beta hydrolase family)